MDNDDELITPSSIEDFDNYFELLDKQRWNGDQMWIGLRAENDNNDRKQFVSIDGTKIIRTNFLYFEKGKYIKMTSHMN